MKIKKFTEFITEKQTDPKLKQKAETSVLNASNKCQRCGEKLDNCACESDDWASTRNAHLIKPGKKESQTAKNK